MKKELSQHREKEICRETWREREISETLLVICNMQNNDGNRVLMDSLNANRVSRTEQQKLQSCLRKPINATLLYL